jgi:hypothetical protein
MKSAMQSLPRLSDSDRNVPKDAAMGDGHTLVDHHWRCSNPGVLIFQGLAKFCISNGPSFKELLPSESLVTRAA